MEPWHVIIGDALLFLSGVGFGCHFERRRQSRRYPTPSEQAASIEGER